MKRISTAAIAAATALSLVAAPAFAQDNTENTGTANETATTAEKSNTEGTAEESTKEEDKAGEDAAKAAEEAKKAAEEAKKAEEEAKKKAEEAKKASKNADNGSSANVGSAVGTITGILAAVLTTGLIVFADPRGLNKIIDALNANFALGIPHVNVPKVQLPF